MGILNVTPDSFSDGGEYYNLDKAIEYSYDVAHTCKFKELDLEEFPTHNLSVYEEFSLTMNYESKGKYSKKNYNRNTCIRHIEPSCTDISHQVYVDVEFYNIEHKIDTSKLKKIFTNYDINISKSLSKINVSLSLIKFV